MEWNHEYVYNDKPHVAKQPFKITNIQNNTAFIIPYNDGDIVRCLISKDFLTNI